MYTCTCVSTCICRQVLSIERCIHANVYIHAHLHLTTHRVYICVYIYILNKYACEWIDTYTTCVHKYVCRHTGTHHVSRVLSRPWYASILVHHIHMYVYLGFHLRVEKTSEGLERISFRGAHGQVTLRCFRCRCHGTARPPQGAPLPGTCPARFRPTQQGGVSKVEGGYQQRNKLQRAAA